MDYKAVAKNGLNFLSRTDLKGSEVGAWVELNQMLGQIMEGKLAVSQPLNQMLGQIMEGKPPNEKPVKEVK